VAQSVISAYESNQREHGLRTLAKLRRQLSEMLGVDVDVVPAAALKPTVAQAVLSEAIAL
jgi:uncharacterized protein